MKKTLYYVHNKSRKVEDLAAIFYYCCAVGRRVYLSMASMRKMAPTVKYPNEGPKPGSNTLIGL